VENWSHSGQDRRLFGLAIINMAGHFIAQIVVVCSSVFRDLFFKQIVASNPTIQQSNKPTIQPSSNLATQRFSSSGAVSEWLPCNGVHRAGG